MAQINFPVATANGQTFEADNGVIYTYVGAPPNGYWSGTFQDQSLQTLDGRYLKLDSSNDPLTGGLSITGGNVGIGTTNPGTKLEVKDNSNPIISVRTNSGGDLRFTAATDLNGHMIRYGGGTDNGSVNPSTLRFVTTSDTERMRIDSDGNVGIGASSSTATLHVQNNDNTPGGNIQTWTADLGTNTRSATLIAPEVDDINDPFIFYTNNAWQFRVDSNDALTIGSDGNVGIGTDSPETLLDVLLSSTGNTVRVQTGRNDLPYTTYRSDTGSYFHVGHNRTLNALAFSQGSNPEGADPMMVVEPTGNVGIGTSNPTADLEVKGDILTGSNSTADKIFAPNHLGTDISAFIQVNAQGDKNP